MAQNKQKKTSKKTLLHSPSLLTEDDIFLFNEGKHFQLYNKLGSHPAVHDGVQGSWFALWAPDAEALFVAGDFNGWNKTTHPLSPKGVSGIWEGFIPGVGKGDVYKYHIHSRFNGYRVDKADPFAFYNELPPKTASIIWDLEYDWGDAKWQGSKKDKNPLEEPMSIYEVHLGSWMRHPEQGNRYLTYREIAPKLADYVQEMGFTHVEFLPLMEHPFYGSWGYQSLGYFAPSSRYGDPQDFMFLIDTLHQKGISVILDWVPSHFPKDEHGLGYFDGTHIYEHSDTRQGLHPDWDSLIFNYGRKEVQSFLTSSAMFWLETYHADGLRVDAVASMLYLDYARENGDWIPNEHGGNENLEAISFLKDLNREIYRVNPSSVTIAEESTSWPMVSRPVYLGGLGFGMKWDMGWMHDTLDYMSKDPVHRKFQHNKLTFRMLYAFHENFVLPLSHDEVVYGKGSLLSRMPGDEWQKFANLRLLFGYMYAQPGKKLIFMGGEFGQWNEWYHEASLDWHLLDNPLHSGLQQWVRDLNRLYREEHALNKKEFDIASFEWIDCNNPEDSIIILLRKSPSEEDIIVACNFTPIPRMNYRTGAPYGGKWKEVLNSDAEIYGGSGLGNMGIAEAEDNPCLGRPWSLTLTLPPLGVVFLKREKE